MTSSSTTVCHYPLKGVVIEVCVVAAVAVVVERLARLAITDTDGHAMAEVGTAEINRRGDPGSAAALVQSDLSKLPLVAEAARHATTRTTTPDSGSASTLSSPDSRGG